MKIKLTVREYIEKVLVLNPNYDNIFIDKYYDFLKDILPFSKKTRSTNMFVLEKGYEEIEIRNNYDPTILSSNEFLSNLITINHKKPFQLLFVKQILDYYFTGKIQPSISNIKIIKNGTITYFTQPMTIYDIIKKYYQEHSFGKPNNRIKKQSHLFKSYYQKPADIPFSDLQKFSYIYKLILNIKVDNTEGIQKILNLIWYHNYKNHKVKKIKTKYKRTDNYDYDLKEHFVRKIENLYGRKSHKIMEPKWGYIHSFFNTSFTNRERKRRYYIDNQDSFLKKPHRNLLRYKRKYRKKKVPTSSSF